MSEIPVYTISPVIFTKDEAWLKAVVGDKLTEPGTIILLPEDAVLYVPRETYSMSQEDFMKKFEPSTK